MKDAKDTKYTRYTEDITTNPSLLKLKKFKITINPDNIMKDRDNKYSNAWIVAGKVVNFIKQNTDVHNGLDKIIGSGYFYNWITILCKLIRAMNDPRYEDNWIDIRNYAELIIRDIQNEHIKDSK